ncbi:MAG: hypothetical protein JNJ58_02805 [Chitinophagaceae bacterium]|nr:hypothetical protein [Chitinophagaceae bacterium]
MKNFKQNCRRLMYAAVLLLMTNLSMAQTFQLITNNGFQFAGGLTPNGHQRWCRSVILITQAEMAAAAVPNGQIFNFVRYNTNVPAAAPASGTVKIYLQNTLDGTNLKSTTWTTAITGMLQVTNSAITLPAVAGPYSINFNLSNFTYTGGGVYVALEYSNVSGALSTTTQNLVSTAGVAATSKTYSTTLTVPATTMTTIGARPEIAMGFTFANDLAISNVYTLGKLPIEYGAPTTIQARVVNVGTAAMAATNATLTISGSNSFTDVQPVNALAPGASQVLTFNVYSPSNLGAGDIVNVSLNTSDNNNTNNSLNWNQDVTPNLYTYKNPSVINNGGVGFTGGTGDFVAKFNSNIGINYPYNITNPMIDEIKVDLTTTGLNYQLGIWDATGPGGTPGTNLWTSGILTSAPGTSFIPVSPNVMVVGDYFVGVRQIGTTNIGFAYQTEAPIRAGTFYYTSPTGGTTWTDFSATSSNFRFSIEVQVHIPVPPNCATNYSPADNSMSNCFTQTLSWASNGGAPTGYDVYFSTIQTDVDFELPSALVASNQPGTTYTPGGLSPNTQYFWKVIPRNADGPAINCGTLNFTTGSLPVCYCVPVHSVICQGSITNVQFNTLSNTSTCTTPGYAVYPPSGATTTNVDQLSTYNLSVTCDTASILSVWIDYNHDGLLDASEWTQVTTASVANVASSVPITISGTSLTGPTLMRVRSRFSGNANGAPDACTTFGSGESEDYVININPPSPCTTPNPGNTIASVASTCPSIPFNLSLQNSTPGITVTYQWQSADDAAFTINVTNLGTGSTETTSQLTAKYYRCQVTCSTGPTTVASNPVFVGVLACYCQPIHTTGTGAGDYLQSVSIPGTTLNNVTGASATPFYTLYPQSGSTTATLNSGSTYTLNAVAGTYTINDVALFIDYDQNGNLDDVAPYTEKIGQIDNIGAGATAAFTFTVPSGLPAGTYRLRVRESDQTGLISSCMTLVWGETEDYEITIAPPPSATLSLNALIQGYYRVATDDMVPVLNNQGEPNGLSDCDTVTVELHDATFPYALAYSYQGVIGTNSLITCSFPGAAIGNSYYIVVKNRTAVETWSAAPVLAASSYSYDFRTASTQAYDAAPGNMIQVNTSPVRWAFYSGDIDQSGGVDGDDFNLLDPDIQSGNGGYLSTDLDGSGGVDGDDFNIFDPNSQAGVGAFIP